MGRTTTVAAAIAMGSTALCRAGDYEGKPLAIGTPAPAIDITHWLKGEQVDEFETGKIYVLEFWATRCRPCLASIPHISKLQEQFRDYGVTFIGVSDEKLQTVAGFLNKTDRNEKLWDDKIRFTLATDPDESVIKDYMVAAGEQTIPTAFIIGKDGTIEWIGNPTRPKGDLDRALDAIVKDGWDRTAYRKIYDLRKQASNESADANYDKALALTDELIALDPHNHILYKHRKFGLLLSVLNRPRAAYEVGRELVDAHWDDAQSLNQISWYVVDDPSVQTRDLQFAMKAAIRASGLTDDKDAAILDTVARVYYEMGDLRSALQWQLKAVEHVDPDSRGGSQLKRTLEKYQKEKAGSRI